MDLKQPYTLDEQIKKIVEAAVKSPSTKNRQPWKYIVYSETAKKELLDVLYSG